MKPIIRGRNVTLDSSGERPRIFELVPSDEGFYLDTHLQGRSWNSLGNFTVEDLTALATMILNSVKEG